MASVFRWAMWSVLIFGVVDVASVWAEDAPVNEKPRVLVTISKETTYITEPLRLDGYPDYVAALNQRCSEGVTPENNSAVLFWKAMGPSSIEEKDREKYFQMLGIPPLPGEGDYFVTSAAWITRQKEKDQSNVEESKEPWNDPLWEQQSQTSNRPWSKDEFPIWAEWIEVNEKPLALIIEASKRPRRYDPLISGEKGTLIEIFGTLSPTIQAYRDIARVLAARAMLRTKEGKIDEAWGDLLACHRLGRLMAQGPTLVEMLVGITVDGIACDKDRRLIQNGHLTASRALKMRDDLARLPPMYQMADKIEFGERFFGLDGVLMVAHEGPSSLWKLIGCIEPSDPLKTAADYVYAMGLDWDIILRLLNSWYDRMAEAMRKPIGVERQKAMKIIQDDLQKLQNSARDFISLGLMMLAEPRRAISERFGMGIVAIFFPVLPACANADNRVYMQFELTKLAFSLAGYHADRGSYPAKLADLEPKYVTDVPRDIFNDGELHYRQEGDGYLLYSVGVNGKDDGGKGYEDLKEYNEGWDDLVIRMPATMQEEKR